MKNMKINFNNIFAFFLVSAPVFNVYSISGFAYGTLYLIILMLLGMMSLIKNHKIRKLYQIDQNLLLILLPLVVLAVNSLIAILTAQDVLLPNVIGRYGYIVIYGVILFESSNFVNFDFAKQVLRFWCAVTVAGLMAQLIAHYVLSIHLSLFIPGLSTATEDIAKRYIIDGGIFRPNSIFNEPSHVAYYLSVGLLVELFFREKEQNLFWRVFLSIGLVVSTSASGIAFLLIIWAMYLLINNLFDMKIICYVILAVGIGGFMIVRLNLSDQLLYTIERFTIGSGRYSGFMDYYSQMTSLEKVFGVGIGNIRVRFAEYYLTSNANMSGLGKFLIEGGFISCITYIVSYGILFFTNKFPKKSIVIFFFILNTIEGSMFGVYLDFVMLWMFYKRNPLVDAKVTKETELNRSLC